MCERFSPSEDIIRRNAEVAFSGCNLEVSDAKEPLELHEKIQAAFDHMSPVERQAHEQYLIELSEFYNGPGGP